MGLLMHRPSQKKSIRQLDGELHKICIGRHWKGSKRHWEVSDGI